MGEEKKTQKDVIQTMREMNAQVISRLFPFFEFLIDFLFFFRLLTVIWPNLIPSLILLDEKNINY